MKKFAYDSPLELPDHVELNPEVIEINGMPFQERSDCNYLHDYSLMIKRAAEDRKIQLADPQRAKREFNIQYAHYGSHLLDDLWMFVYFVLKNPLANHPFVVNACKEVQEQQGDAMYMWARNHLKSTIITVARTCQKILDNPEQTTAIISATRGLALAFQNQIKKILESPFLITIFPNILHQNPKADAERWSDDGGLFVKRKGLQKEPTVSAYGLYEGMPTGFHFDNLIFDDIVTPELVNNKDVMTKVKENFDMVQNVGSRTFTSTVIGTFYHHDDPLVYISGKTDPITNEPLYKMSKKTATIDGTLNGASVFESERKLAKLRTTNLYFFYCQQLLDPTPRGTGKLNPGHIIEVRKEQLPERLYKFMLIDPAGDKATRSLKNVTTFDSWAFGVIGVKPFRDDKGFSDIYILDLYISPQTLDEACETAVQMYLRNGRILQLGIEKVGISTVETHICNALRAKNKFVSLENENLVILRPEGRSKEFRIESALSSPLKNGKVHILDTIEENMKERLFEEMRKFPLWHNDGIDMVSYSYDIIKNYKFGALPEEQKELDRWERKKLAINTIREDGWYAV